jgi:hypothetical protein
MMLITGFLNVANGFVALYRTRLFANHFVFGDLRTWAWILLAFGALQVLAGFAILGGREWGRWIGIVVVCISATIQLLAIAAYPLWSIAIIAYDVVIFYALAARWTPRPSLQT